MTKHPSPDGKLVFPFAEAPAPGDVAKIDDDILWARFPLPMALDHVNVYFLRDDDGWTIVDTGIDSRKSRALWSSLFGGPLSEARPKRLIVTHHHPDHLGLAGWLQHEYGVELLTSRTAWLFARMLTLDEQAVPRPETLAYWRAAGMPESELSKRADLRPFNFADVVSDLPLGFTGLQDGMRLRMGRRDWTVRLAQGHAPDHVVLFSDDGRFVLAGDHYLATISPNLGVYATEPQANPVLDWLASHRHLLPFLKPSQLALPGHGMPFQGLPFRAHQLIENHVSALARLEDYLTEPNTAVGCFRTIFKRDISEGEYTLALVEAMAHCLSLWHSGRATRDITEDGRWVFTAKETRDG